MKNKLWTRDFTIITVGSAVSMLGSVLSGFAMSLLVLDYTGDPFLFALYNVFYMIPSIIVPIFIGPFLDRFSRRKTIYTLDFISSGLFMIFAAMLKFGIFNFPILAVSCLLLGTIEAIYYVAYDSFYPLLVSEGNFQKAYSVASTLETFTMVMVPLSAVLYDKVGIVPLFIFNAVSYFIAAVMETRIGANEKYIEKQKENTGGKQGLKLFVSDFKDGMSYIRTERGLFAITAYFAFSAMLGGATGALTLPYFTGAFENGKYMAVLTWSFASVGRMIFGVVHYKVKLPKKRKLAIALFVYITIAVIDGIYLFLPVFLMCILCFIEGSLGVTSYTIRISATQRYVPDERKGRFNGTFATVMTVGTIIGQLSAGALAETLPIRGILAGFAIITLLSAIAFIGFGRRQVGEIYNTED